MKWLSIARKLDGKQLRENLISTFIHNKMIGLLVLLSVISIYALYILLTIQGVNPSNQSIIDVLYRAGIMSIGVFSFITIIFIYFTRNKLLTPEYKHFFSSVSMSTLEIILANYYYVFIFTLFFYCFVMLPVFLVIIFFYEITFFMLFSMFLMLLSLPLLFFLILNVWIISYLLAMRLNNNFRNSLLTILFIIFSFVLIVINLISGNRFSLLNLYLNSGFVNYLVSLSLIIIYISLNIWGLNKLSSIYLGNLFKEKLEDGFIKYKVVNISKWRNDSPLLRQINLELLRLYRTNLYMEPIFIVIFLGLIIVVAYKMLNFEVFTSIYNLVFQFGMIEAMIIVLISLGSEFLKTKFLIYSMNWNGFIYLFGRFLIYIISNICIYLLFILGVTTIVSDISVDLLTLFQYIRIVSITILAITIGFIWPIQEFNKLFLILVFILCYGIIELIILNFNIPFSLINFLFGILIPFVCVFVLKKKFLKGPITK
ncbi:hypothetical protein ACQKMV_15605 [Lysinibacillus sp. NPDC094403]|uniref:hypothetical protein n=1 Tax=Lysinibacillus sp. NPDC094403 TaxID=3390581 RepID=UPI003D053415